MGVTRLDRDRSGFTVALLGHHDDGGKSLVEVISKIAEDIEVGAVDRGVVWLGLSYVRDKQDERDFWLTAKES